MPIEPFPRETELLEEIARLDIGWFDANPRRRYRLRRSGDGRRWAIRRFSGNLFLRTVATSPIVTEEGDDEERTAEAAWWQSAWPELSNKARRKAAKRARRRRPS